MGPFHILLRIGEAHSNASEQALVGEPFFDNVLKRFEIVTGPTTKIQYPTVNELGGLGVGFDEVISTDYSLKIKFSMQAGNGSLSIPAYGAYNVTSTGVYFGVTSNKKWMGFCANGVQVAQVWKDLFHLKKDLRVDGNANIYGNVTADDFILSSVNKVFQLTGGGSLVDTFVYDTRDDSDGGAWRESTNYSSWANEAASSTRSARKKFPARAIIVATANWLSIYDGDDVTLPLWMRFTIGSGKHIVNTIQGVDAYNGSIYVATSGGVYQVDFIRDVTLLAKTTGRYQSSTPIASRNLSVNNFIKLAQYGSQYWLPSDNVKAVSVNYSMDLKPNRVTGLPEPCIDMVFAAGCARMLSNRVILDTAPTATDVYPSLHTSRNGDVVSYNYTQNRLEMVRAHQSTPSIDLTRLSKYPIWSALGNQYFGFAFDTASTRKTFISSAEKGVYALGYIGVQGATSAPVLAYLAEDRTQPSKGMFSLLSTTWMSPWCVGKTIGSWLCNSITANRVPVANALTQIGAVTEAYEGNSELAYYTFDDSNYVKIPYAANKIDIPDGDWSFIWHMQLPATTERQVIFDIASGDYGDNFMRFEIEATTSKGVFKYNCDPYTIEIKTQGAIDFGDWGVCILSRNGWWITLQINGVVVFSVNLQSPAYDVADNANLALANTGASLFIGRAANAPTNYFQGKMSMFRFSHSAPNYEQSLRITEWELDLMRNTEAKHLLGGSIADVKDVDGDPFTSSVLLSSDNGVFKYSRFNQDFHYTTNNSSLYNNAVIKSSLRGNNMCVLSSDRVWVLMPEIRLRESLNNPAQQLGKLEFQSEIGGTYEEIASGTATITRTQVAVIVVDDPGPIDVVVVVDPDDSGDSPTPDTLPPPTNSITLFSGDTNTGTSITYEAPYIPYISRFRQASETNWNDLAGSITVVGEWTVFEHAEYRGRSARLTTGVYPKAALQARGLWKNISSIRRESNPIVAPTGVTTPTTIPNITIGNLSGILGGTINIAGLGTPALVNSFIQPGTDERLNLNFEYDDQNGIVNVVLEHPASTPAVATTIVQPSTTAGGSSRLNRLSQLV